VKIINFLYLTIFTISLSSCTKEDISINNTILEGKWNLMTRVCKCPLINLDKGEDVWSFDTVNKKLTIANNVSNLYPYLNKTSTLSFKLDSNRLELPSNTYHFTFKKHQLILDSGNLPDSPLLIFERD